MEVTVNYGIGGNLKEVILSFSEITKEFIQDYVPYTKGLYLFKDVKGKIIYVGETKNLRKRLDQHVGGRNNSKKFYKMIDKILYTELDVSKYERLVIEGLLVLDLQPTYNVTAYDSITKGRSYVDDNVVLDIMYYVNVIGIKPSLVAKKFNYSKATITTYAAGRTTKKLILPDDYVPKLQIDYNPITDKKRKSQLITKDVFINVKNDIDRNILSGLEIRKKYDIPHATFQSITNLKAKKYQRWEQERLNGNCFHCD